MNAINLPIPEFVKLMCLPHTREIDIANLPPQDIITAASELTLSITSINSAIKIIHPGNTSQYYALPVEFGVRL